MIRITKQDFDKLVKFLAKEGQDGAVLSFRIEDVALIVKTVDKSGTEMVLTIKDEQYRRLPTVTKTETF